MFEPASDNSGTLRQLEQQQQQQSHCLTVNSVFLRVQPAACGKQYWRWRYQRDVIKLDFAYGIMTVCRVAASAYACTAPRWCLGLVLLSALLQLSMIAWRRPQYVRVRLALVCLLRLAWMCFSCYALRGIHARAFFRPGLAANVTAALPALRYEVLTAAAAAAAPGQQLQAQQLAPGAAGVATVAAAAARAAAGEVAVLFAAASWLANLALQPLLQPVPFVLQAPLQALEVGLLLRQFHAIAFLHVEALPGLAAVMFRLHALCEGVFHVAAGFVFVTPAVLAGCRPGDLRLVTNFVVVYAGLLLPLFLLYKAELLGKARFALSYAAGLTSQQAGGADGGEAAAAATTTDVSGSSRAAAAAAAAPVPAQLVGSAAAAGQAQGRLGDHAADGSSGCLARLQLVGWLQPISQEFLLEMLRCPGVRIKDDVICAMLLLLVTWGLCAWATPKLL
uniref:Uncharacterized protein n=1 Tax=Tetradesmus obliquus TaxID=3088 RepID=A0A383V7M6_TETOB|eukprot:jgi/Sobl393_1/13382/SZX60739.1